MNARLRPGSVPASTPFHTTVKSLARHLHSRAKTNRKNSSSPPRGKRQVATRSSSDPSLPVRPVLEGDGVYPDVLVQIGVTTQPTEFSEIVPAVRMRWNSHCCVSGKARVVRQCQTAEVAGFETAVYDQVCANRLANVLRPSRACHQD